MTRRSGKQTSANPGGAWGRIPRPLRVLAVASAWLAIWYLAYRSIGHDVLFASPVQVASRFAALIHEPGFWRTVATSLGRVVAGMSLGTAAGVVLAILTASSRLLSDFLRPVIGMVKSTPVTSFIVLAMLWISRGRVPVFISFLMVLPVVWASVAEGIRRRDARLLEMGRVFRMSRLTRLRLLDIPMVLPYFMAAFNSALGLAWKAGITAEVISNPAFSIGGEIYDAKIYLETVDLFVWTTVLVLVSFGLERTLRLVIRKAGESLHIRTETPA